MPQFCQYRNCHNLGSSSFWGYCNENHFQRGLEDDKLFHVLEQNPQPSTIRDARLYMSSIGTAVKSEDSQKKRQD